MSVKFIHARVTNPSPSHSQLQERSPMSIKKLSLSSALSGRTHNPKKRSGGAKLSSAARQLIADGLSHREDNPRKKRKARKGRKAAAGRRLKKGSAEAKARMAKLRAMKGTKKSRKGRKGRKSRKGAARRAASSAVATSRKASSKGRKARKGASRRGRKTASRRNNPSARVRHALAKHGRKHNPGFDVKTTLIETAILLGGTLAALYVQPHINKFLADTVGLKDKNLGFAKLVGAALTAAGGIYLQERFGDKIGYDIRPATYALATFMAVEGFQESGLAPAAAAPTTASPDAKPGNGTFMLTGPVAPANGTFALTGPSMMATVLPGLNDPNAMLGSYGMHGLGYEDYGMHGTEGDSWDDADYGVDFTDYGMGATVLANLSESNAMLGSIFDQEDPMHGTIFTASELPQAVVAPHNVMQGQVSVPQMC